ncbi:MAG: hypothetical protein ACTHM9_16475 [Gemmatimonadales bacterium]
MHSLLRASLLLIALLGADGPAHPSPAAAQSAATPSLVGQWRATLHFSTGAFAPMKDLEFMYVFNLGGTMTESSNYDAAPPVPPAYGIWRKVGGREFEAKYEFYVTKAPAAFAEIVKGGGWGPAGRGVFVERITLSPDGRSFTSTITYDQFDVTGKPVSGGGAATGRGVRLRF